MSSKEIYICPECREIVCDCCGYCINPECPSCDLECQQDSEDDENESE